MGKAIRIIVLVVILVALVVGIVMVMRGQQSQTGPDNATLQSAEPAATEGGE